MKPEPTFVVAVKDTTFSDSPNLANLPPKKEIPGRRRIVKDVLSVGRWFIGKDVQTGEDIFWPVSTESLQAIADAFTALVSDGITPGLYWSHSTGEKPPEQLDSVELQKFIDIALDARGRIDDIDALFVENDTLYLVAYVTEQDFADLTDKRRDVSIGVLWNFRDGRGKLWPVIPWHVAVVGHGTVPSQQPFLELSAHTGDQMAISFESTLSGVNTLLVKLEIEPLSTEGENAVTEENFDERFAEVVASVDSSEDEDEMADETKVVNEDGPEVDVAELSANVNKLTETVAKLSGGLVELSATVGQMASSKVNEGKDAYNARLDELVGGGFDPERAEKLRDAGEAVGYDLSMLEGFSGGIELGSKTGGHVTAKEPDVDSALSEANMAKARKDLGLKPKPE